MLISKTDVYRREWLELVFNNRNKAYGAYYLRQHYAGNMVKAMGIAFFSIAVLCTASIILKSNPAQIKLTHVDVTPLLPVFPPPVKAIKKAAPPAQVKPLKTQPPAQSITTQKFVAMVVKPDVIAENPPQNITLTTAIGTETVKGQITGTNTMPPTIDNGDGPPVADETVHTTVSIDVMPEPVGGEAAWAKFLNKNLRFPAPAQEEGVSGKVFLSFIIEKDGHLSNIMIEHGAGHGFDEEALRVLKLAKAWKPGMQNGQPVRVKYVIPINFQTAQ